LTTTHFVTTIGQGQEWEKAKQSNVPVVRLEWLEQCERAGRLVGVRAYYLDSPEIAVDRKNATESNPINKPTPEPRSAQVQIADTKRTTPPPPIARSVSPQDIPPTLSNGEDIDFQPARSASTNVNDEASEQISPHKRTSDDMQHNEVTSEENLSSPTNINETHIKSPRLRSNSDTTRNMHVPEQTEQTGQIDDSFKDVDI